MLLRRVCHRESDSQSIGIAFDRALLDQSTNSKSPSGRCFLGGYLRRTKEKHQIVLKSVESQRRGDSQTRKPGNNKANSL